MYQLSAKHSSNSSALPSSLMCATEWICRNAVADNSRHAAQPGCARHQGAPVQQNQLSREFYCYRAALCQYNVTKLGFCISWQSVGVMLVVKSSTTVLTHTTAWVLPVHNILVMMQRDADFDYLASAGSTMIGDNVHRAVALRR
jgi:hypothetical protein